MGCARTIFKILHIFLGMVMLAQSVFRFINISKLDFLGVLLNIYFIFFSLLIVLVELGMSKVSFYFSFERTWLGKGLFLLFCGILFFDVPNLKHMVFKFNLVCGILLIVLSVIFIIVGCGCMKDDDLQDDPNATVTNK